VSSSVKLTIPLWRSTSSFHIRHILLTAYERHARECGRDKIASSLALLAMTDRRCFLYR
jgi:hypothetical protein